MTTKWNTFLSSGYVVEKRDKKSGEWVRCSDQVRGTEVTISKLKEGQEYEFRVMAENANGLSEPLTTDRSTLVKNPFSKSNHPAESTHSTVQFESNR